MFTKSCNGLLRDVQQIYLQKPKDMTALKNLFVQSFNFFTGQNIASSTSSQSIVEINAPEVCTTSKDTDTYRDFFEDMPPMNYYLLSAHLFMP